MPTETSVTVEFDWVQTAGVVETKLTVNPDEAVPVTTNGAVPNAWFDSAANVIV